MIIKVCGLNSSPNIQSVDALQPDLLGLIFHPGSPRYAGNNHIPSTDTPKVGVFVNSTAAHIIGQAETYHLKHIQLHGDEDPLFVKSIYEKGFSVIKAFSIGQSLDQSRMRAFEPYCGYFLFDTKGKNAGGNGLKFNWRLLQNYTLKTPFLLSGGIGPGDAEALKSLYQPGFAGIDINSGFEISPGIKNIELIKTFIHDIRK